MLGLFGSLFDLNNDGELSPEEMALELFLFDEIVYEPLRTNSEDSEEEKLYEDELNPIASGERKRQ